VVINFENDHSYSGYLKPYAKEIIAMFDNGASTSDIAALLNKYQQQGTRLNPWGLPVSPQVVRYLLMRAGKYQGPAHSPLPLPDELNALTVQEKLALPISHLPLTARPLHALSSNAIDTVNELINRTSAELLRKSNFGKVSLAEVEGVLAALGFQLADRPPPITSIYAGLNGAAANQSPNRCQCAAADRARIVAWLRHEADHGPVGGAVACRYVADLLEREEHSK